MKKDGSSKYVYKVYLGTLYHVHFSPQERRLTPTHNSEKWLSRYTHTSRPNLTNIASQQNLLKDLLS